MATGAPTKRMIVAAKLVAVTISFTYVAESPCLLGFHVRHCTGEVKETPADEVKETPVKETPGEVKETIG